MPKPRLGADPLCSNPSYVLLYLTGEREQRSVAATVEQAAPLALTAQIGPTDQAEADIDRIDTLEQQFARNRRATNVQLPEHQRQQ